MGESRVLDLIEEFELSAEPGVFVMEYRGHVDEYALDLAFKSLCERNPVLGACIESHGERHFLTVNPNLNVEFVVTVDGDYEWDAREWELNRAVTRLKLVRGKSRGFVMLGISHAVVDFTSHMAYCHELWDLYTGIVAGTAESTRPRKALPCAPSVLLGERWAKIEAAPSEKSPVPVGAGCVRYISSRRRFSENDTRSIVSAARVNNTTVGAIVGGAATVAMRSRDSRREAIPMKIGTTVDLRPHVSPKVDPTETTYFCGKHIDAVSVEAEADPIGVGVGIRARLTCDISKRAVHLLGYSTNQRQSFQYVRWDHVDVHLNNAGRAPELAHPAEVEIVDLFVLQAEQQEWEAPNGTAPRSLCASYTFNGELSVVYMVPLTLVSVIEEFGDQIDAIIERFEVK